jgi:hypothetical protein
MEINIIPPAVPVASVLRVSLLIISVLTYFLVMSNSNYGWQNVGTYGTLDSIALVSKNQSSHRYLCTSKCGCTDIPRTNILRPLKSCTSCYRRTVMVNVADSILIRPRQTVDRKVMAWWRDWYEEVVERWVWTIHE